MQGLVLALLLISVCACVFLVFKVYKELGEIRQEVVSLRMMPRGAVVNDDNVTPSGMPKNELENDSVIPDMSAGDFAKVMRMVQEYQGGR